MIFRALGACGCSLVMKSRALAPYAVFPSVSQATFARWAFPVSRARYRRKEDNAASSGMTVALKLARPRLTIRGNTLGSMAVALPEIIVILGF